MLSEVDRRIAETKKDMYEFKRDVIGELHSHIARWTAFESLHKLLSLVRVSVKSNGSNPQA